MSCFQAETKGCCSDSTRPLKGLGDQKEETALKGHGLFLLVVLYDRNSDDDTVNAQ